MHTSLRKTLDRLRTSFIVLFVRKYFILVLEFASYEKIHGPKLYKIG